MYSRKKQIFQDFTPERDEINWILRQIKCEEEKGAHR